MRGQLGCEWSVTSGENIVATIGIIVGLVFDYCRNSIRVMKQLRGLKSSIGGSSLDNLHLGFVAGAGL